jgi:hypothetical protein
MPKWYGLQGLIIIIITGWRLRLANGTWQGAVCQQSEGTCSYGVSSPRLLHATWTVGLVVHTTDAFIRVGLVAISGPVCSLHSHAAGWREAGSAQEV